MLMSTRKPLFDPAQVSAAVSRIIEPGAVFEFRAVGALLDSDRRKGIVYGYFNTVEALLKQLSRIRAAKGFYIVVNPVDPKLLYRACNVLNRGGETDTTADKDIVRRRWLIIDCDVERPTDISSSAAEHDAALSRAAKIRAELSAEGWPQPLYGSSGNGGRLLYRINLPTDDDGLVKRVLHALQDRFGDTAIKVDCTVFNPARIDKLPGTLVCKGSDTPERPHRMAEIIDSPSTLNVVPTELLAAVAAEAPTEKTSGSGETNGKLTMPLFGNGDPKAVERARQYIAKCPPAVQGSNGSKAAYNVARYLVIGFGLSRSDALAVMGEYSKRCQPEWTVKELEHKIDDAAKLPGDRGHKLEANNAAEPASGNTTRAKPAEKRGSVTVAAYRPFPIELLPQRWADVVQNIADTTGGDPAYAALPTAAAFASAIGNSRRLRGGNKRGWHVPAIVWTVNIGVSGSGKSPPPNLALRPIKRREAKLYHEHAEAMTDYEVDCQRHDLEVKLWKGRKGVGETPIKPKAPIAERCLVGDTTLEALAPILRDNPRGLLLHRDELAGWFGSFDRYAGKGKASADAAQWLSIFDGDTIIIDRKTGGQRIYVPAATISVCGGIQPDTLKRALSHEHRANGLAARLLFAHPPRKPKQWSESDIDLGIEQRYIEVLDRLYELQPDEDEHGDPCPVIIGMTHDAKQRYVRFYNEHNLEQAMLDGDLAAAWTKLEQYPLRLGLVIHLVRWASGDPHAESELVDEASIEAGIELTKWFAHEAERVYAVLDEAVVDQEMRELVELIHRHGGRIRVRDVQHALVRYRGQGGAKEVEADLNAITAAGLGDWIVVEPGPAGGQPAREFVLRDRVTVTEPRETRGILSSVTVTDDCGPVSGDIPSVPRVPEEEDLWTA
jgi:hypothetical protein